MYQNINGWFDLAYWIVFVYLVRQYRLFKWCYSVLALVLVTLWGAWYWGGEIALSYGQRLGLVAILSFPHIFVVPTSWFALFRYSSEKAPFIQLRPMGRLPTLFIIAGGLQYLSLLILLGLVWSKYPSGISIYALAAILDVFFMQTAFWVCSHFCLMFLLWLSQRLQKKTDLSIEQCKTVLLISLILQILFFVQTMMRHG